MHAKIYYALEIKLKIILYIYIFLSVITIMMIYLRILKIRKKVGNNTNNNKISYIYNIY